MKTEAEVKFLEPKGQFNVGECISVSVDEDYCIDYDDIIKYVETELWEKHGVNAYNDVDFEIVNQEALCSELDESIGMK